MSAETIIADIEADLANFSSEGKAVLATILARLTAVETATTNIGAAIGGPVATALADASSLVTQALTAGATVAASATNPLAAAVAIGNVAAPVTGLFVTAFNGAKGVIEGLEGQTAPAGASAAEQVGDSAGLASRNFFDAIVDAIEGKTPPAPVNPSGAVGG